MTTAEGLATGRAARGRAARDPARRRTERGGATVMAVACAGVLLLVGAALGVVAAMVVAHRTAQSAADLAALAAASSLGAGGDACVRAAEITAANGADLRVCDVVGWEVSVAVVVGGPHWLGQGADLTAQARAGPVS